MIDKREAPNWDHRYDGDTKPPVVIRHPPRAYKRPGKQMCPNCYVRLYGKAMRKHRETCKGK